MTITDSMIDALETVTMPSPPPSLEEMQIHLNDMTLSLGARIAWWLMMCLLFPAWVLAHPEVNPSPAPPTPPE